MLEIINLPNSKGAKEFLNIPEENIVYKVPENITEFIEIFKKQSEENTNDLNDLDEIDDTVKLQYTDAFGLEKKYQYIEISVHICN
ncbi:hypothetical protein GLOIN_2v1771578 [Rhizophagus irregularis DAOM 181602=DAOM 197198]|nr:hypothetical protein GLOIN_2v1771578 [Rhizophagus irregularis DAOM 181602=DAOM 197198]